MERRPYMGGAGFCVLKIGYAGRILGRHYSPVIMAREEQERLIREEDQSSGSAITQDRTIIIPKRKVIVEPVLFMYCLAMIGSVPLVEQYLYDRFKQDYPILTNRTENHTETACRRGVTNTSDPYYMATQSVQQETSRWIMYLQVTSSLINIFTTIIYGAYSDAAGRRIVLMLPSGVMTMKFTLNSFIIYFDLPVYYFLIGQVLEGLGGGYATLTMAVFAYIADITTPEERGMRLALAEVSLTLAVAVSQIGLGYFIRDSGFFYPQLTLTGILFINMIYLVFLVPETVVRNTGRQFSVTASVVETYSTYTDRKDNRSVKVLLMASAIFLAYFPMSSRYPLQILFVMNMPLCWAAREIGIYMGVCAVFQQLGGLVAIKCLKLRRVSETWIALFGCLSVIASNLVNAWADTTLLMLLVCVAGVLLVVNIPMYRTIVSRLVRADEQGKVFSGIACLEAAGSMAGSVVMNTIYQETLYFMRGFVFTVAALFALAAGLITILYMCYDRRRVTVGSPEQGKARCSHRDLDDLSASIEVTS